MQKNYGRNHEHSGDQYAHFSTRTAIKKSAVVESAGFKAALATIGTRLRAINQHAFGAPVYSQYLGLFLIIGGGAILSMITVLGFLLFATEPPSSPAVASLRIERSVEPATVRVAVAAQPITEMTELAEEFFRLEDRPIADIDLKSAVMDLRTVNGKFSQVALHVGQEIRLSDLTSKRPIVPFESKIPAGYRAVAINVDALSSIEGFMQPGNRVDVTWIGRVGSALLAKCILENSEVLSVERRTSTQAGAAPGPQGVPGTTTLLASSQNATTIQLASSTGKLVLTLRGEKDNRGSSCASGISTADLLGPSKRPETAAVCGIRVGDLSYRLENDRLVECAE